MREEQSPGAGKFSDLPPAVQTFLDRLDPENIETLEYLAGIEKKEVQSLMKVIRDGRAIAWFIKWGIVGLFALLLATVSLIQAVQFLIGYIKGTPPP